MLARKRPCRHSREFWEVVQRWYKLEPKTARMLPSDTCKVRCRRCLAEWRTKALYTDDLPDVGRERRANY